MSCPQPRGRFRAIASVVARKLAPRWQRLGGSLQCLFDLAHHEDGLRDGAVVAQQVALLAEPVVQRVLGPGVRPDRALNELLTEMIDRLEELPISRGELEAVCLLLNAHVPLASHPTMPIGHVNRAEAAARLCFLSYARFRRDGRPKDAVPTSPETRLLDRFLGAAREIEAHPSATASMGWSPRSPQRVEANVEDLLGSWAGITETAKLLKSRDASRSRRHACVMTIMSPVPNKISVTWYYATGTAYAAAMQLADTEAGRRLLVTYESTVSWLPGDQPTHRGTAVLDINGADASVRIEGPYFTDRRTDGTLTFYERMSRTFDSYAEARAELHQRIGDRL